MVRDWKDFSVSQTQRREDEVVGGGGDAGADGGRSQEETRGNLWPLLLQVNICQVRCVCRTNRETVAPATGHFSPAVKFGQAHFPRKQT